MVARQQDTPVDSPPTSDLPKCAYRHCKRPARPSGRFCSSKCMGRARWKIPDNDDLNGLQKRFVGRVILDDLTLDDACIAAGLKPRSGRQWLTQRRTKNGAPPSPPRLHRLRGSGLCSVAAWLGIDETTAIAEQGGTVKEQRRAHILEQRDSKKAQQARAKFLKDRKRRKAWTEKRAAKQTGKELTQERRDRISASITRYFSEHPERKEHSLGQKTVMVMSAFRRSRKDWPEERLKAEAVRRLLAPPYNFCDATAAQVLLMPMPQIRELERAARSEGHRPSEELRHHIVESVRATWLHSHASFRGVWPTCVDACEAAGLAIPGADRTAKANALVRWWSDHVIHRCALLDRALFPPEKPKGSERGATGFSG